jgi:HSP20 family molecular chaperone IbpA
MFIHPMWWLNRPSLFEFPKFEMTGTSSFKYTEDNDVITYTITVPENCSEEDIQAFVKDGVLTLTLPKLVEKQTKGEIKVNRVG